MVSKNFIDKIVSFDILSTEYMHFSRGAAVAGNPKNLIEPEKVKKERKELKRDYKLHKKELKRIEKTSELLGEVLTRGFLTTYVLYLLEKGPLCGNEILKQIGTRTENRWQPSSGGVYPLLRRLEKKGYISGKWEDSEKRTRRNYQLTREGKAELKRLINILKPKAENTLKVFNVIVKDLFGRRKER